ncbi:MAG: hypothetical protein IPM81_20360 [Saprospirales bacterium]|nr:hypothetical protein [Saprospirales bacterium]
MPGSSYVANRVRAGIIPQVGDAAAAVKVVLPPVQKESEPPIVAVGSAFTVTVFEQDEVQPAFVTVKVTV